ncbi:NmrA family NAD(P)-binding protein [Kribbella deserti]|uniref:NmrA family NAD(P)-binding protein n=1 Tax=Kribbella deserti TaxID=1926257 RepID=A0ABV6QVX3_9ACTN
MTRTILVTGATGNVGRHVVTGLLAAGVTVRALVRNPALAGLPVGVELVAGDLTDPASVAAASTGTDGTFLLWPFYPPDGAEKVVEQLTGHVVYLSASAVRDDQSAEQNGVWGTIEQLVRKAGLDWTFLRAGGFAANTLEWSEQTLRGDEVHLPYTEAGRSLIHERDIAEVAVRALLDRRVGETLTLTGPETLTQREQIRIIGEVIDRPLRVVEVSPEVARAHLVAQLGEEFAAEAMPYWASLVENPEGVETTVENVLGRPALTYREWVEDHADAFRPLTTTEVAERYVEAFRGGAMESAMTLLSPEMERIAPIEFGGDPTPLKGLNAIFENSVRLLDGHVIEKVDVQGPFLAGNQFAVRFIFGAGDLDLSDPGTTSKMSLYTVTNSRIVREEVFYFTLPDHPAP